LQATQPTNVAKKICEQFKQTDLEKHGKYLKPQRAKKIALKLKMEIFVNNDCTLESIKIMWFEASPLQIYLF